MFLPVLAGIEQSRQEVLRAEHAGSYEPPSRVHDNHMHTNDIQEEYDQQSINSEQLLLNTVGSDMTHDSSIYPSGIIYIYIYIYTYL